MRKLHKRDRGSIAGLGFIAVVPLVAAIGGFAVDCMHVNDAKGELQRATDASALAGAQDFNNYVGPVVGPYTATNASNPEPVNFALKVGALNAVDGPSGVYTNSNRSIKVWLEQDQTLPHTGVQPNVCHVQSQIKTSSLFAKIFGNYGQTVTADAWAGGFAANKVSNFMPLLVSLHDPDPKGNRLENMAVGQQYTVSIKDMNGNAGGNGNGNGNQTNSGSSNSVWIWNSNKDDKAAIDHIADPVKYPTTPDLPITVQNSIEDLGNGVTPTDVLKLSNGEKHAGADFDLLYDPVNPKTVVFLVTEDNQQDILAKGTPRHKVIGFIALKVTGYDNKGGSNGYSLTGTLVPFNAGEYDPNGGANQLTGFVPYLVRLVN